MVEKSPEQVAAEGLGGRLLAVSRDTAPDERRGTVLTGYAWAAAELIAEYPNDERKEVAQKFFDCLAERVTLIARKRRRRTN